MLILDYPEWNQNTILSALIPAEIYKMTPELEYADKVLNDPSFEASVVSKFNVRFGRPTLPLRVYIRMMFLKQYLGTSHQGVVNEATHNLMYRHFCHIPLERKIPYKTTLARTTAKYGSEFVSGITEDILAKLKKAKSKRKAAKKAAKNAAGKAAR